MRRHHIRIGDLTTANGVVVSAASNFILLDRRVALEGDKIACRGCRSTGTIICIGPRHPEYYEGRQVALEGDLCACRCPIHPRLIPSQGVRFQDVDGSYADVMNGSSIGKRQSAADQAATSADNEDDKWIKFRLNETGSCEGLSCIVHFDDGSQMSGEFDADNQIAFYGISGNHVERIEFVSEDTESSSSITEVLLGKLGA